MKVLNNTQLEEWFHTQQIAGGFRVKLDQDGLGEPWQVQKNNPYPISRSDQDFHRAVAVTIESIGNQPKKKWSQFMVEMLNTRKYKDLDINGIILMARTEVDGKKYYLVQAKAEGGALNQVNSVFLTTTIQASFSNAQMNPGKIPLWNELAPDLSGENPNTKVAPSIEDPGIFYGKHNLLAMCDLSLEKADSFSIPSNYVWADREGIRQLQLSGDAAQFVGQVLGTFE